MDPLPSGSATVSFIWTANLLILGLRMTLPHKVHWRHQWRQHKEDKNAVHIDQIPIDDLEPVTSNGSPLPHEMLSIRTSLFTWPLPGKQPWTRDRRILPNSLRSLSVGDPGFPRQGGQPWKKLDRGCVPITPLDPPMFIFIRLVTSWSMMNYWSSSLLIVYQSLWSGDRVSEWSQGLLC